MISSDENYIEEKDYDDDDISVGPASFDTIDPRVYGTPGMANQEKAQDNASHDSLKRNIIAYVWIQTDTGDLYYK